MRGYIIAKKSEGFIVVEKWGDRSFFFCSKKISKGCPYPTPWAPMTIAGLRGGADLLSS